MACVALPKRQGPRLRTYSVVFWVLCGFAGVGLTCGCAAMHPISGIPADKLPEEYRYSHRSDRETIDLSLLRQKQPDAYRLDAGDILSVAIDGVLEGGGAATGARELPPVHFSNAQENRSAVGFPVTVQDNGTITLPYAPPISVRGLTVPQLQQHLRKVYTQDHPILKPGADRIFVALHQKRTYRVLVIRQESGNRTRSLSTTDIAADTNNKWGAGRAVSLPAYRNDVLNALAETGGMPGLDAENAIYVIRRRHFGPGAQPTPLTTLRQAGGRGRGTALAMTTRPGHDQPRSRNAAASNLPSGSNVPTSTLPTASDRSHAPGSSPAVRGGGYSIGGQDRSWDPAGSSQGKIAPPIIRGQSHDDVDQYVDDVEMSRNDSHRSARAVDLGAGHLRHDDVESESDENEVEAADQHQGPHPDFAQGTLQRQDYETWAGAESNFAEDELAGSRDTFSQRQARLIDNRRHPSEDGRPNVRAASRGAERARFERDALASPVSDRHMASRSLSQKLIPEADPGPVPSLPHSQPGPPLEQSLVPGDHLPVEAPAGTLEGFDWSQSVIADGRTLNSPHVIRIPIRIAPGEPLAVSEQDIILEDGDVVFIETRNTDFFYTGGLLGGNQFMLPRDYDVDVVEALAIVQGTPRQQSAYSKAIGGASVINQDVTVGASQLIIIRRQPDGSLQSIKVDLYKAVCDPAQRIIVQTGDLLILQYSRTEAFAAFFERQFLEGMIWGVSGQVIR